ncbi:MAG TPA: Crp/Fnr family transcriptional regulator [Bacteroidales bacterium]|nr:Crp/Fnr family transcriptional regulator [Bacteroidales bacterium]
MKKKNDSEEIVSLVSLWNNFGLLTAAQLEMVLKNSYNAGFRPGEVIVKQGSPASSVVFISDGLVKVYMEGSGEKNIILRLAAPGKPVLDPGLFISRRNTLTVTAVSRTEVNFVSTEILQRLSGENSSFSTGILKELSQQMFLVQNKLASVAGKRMAGRLADTLLYLSEDIFKKNEFDIVLSRKEIGEMSNMAKECVVRVLNELEEEGAVKTDSSRIIILNPDKLREISDQTSWM